MSDIGKNEGKNETEKKSLIPGLRSTFQWAGEEPFQDKEGQRKVLFIHSLQKPIDWKCLVVMSWVIKHALFGWGLGGGRAGTEEDRTDSEVVVVVSKWFPRKTGNPAYKGYFCL